MTKTRRNVTIYSGVILLFGLILMITLIVIYDRITVTDIFGDETLELGSFVVSDFEDGKNYTVFSVVNPNDFIEKHVLNHENYLYVIDDHELDAKYYIFKVERSIFTLKYVEYDEMFYLYSGIFYVEHQQKTYAMPYVEPLSNQINQDIFKTYEDLKTFYMHMYQADTHDQSRIIDIEAYEISLETNIVNYNQFIHVKIEYINDDIVITFP